MCFSSSGIRWTHWNFKIKFLTDITELYNTMETTISLDSIFTSDDMKHSWLLSWQIILSSSNNRKILQMLSDILYNYKDNILYNPSMKYAKTIVKQFGNISRIRNKRYCMTWSYHRFYGRMKTCYILNLARSQERISYAVIMNLNNGIGVHLDWPSDMLLFRMIWHLFFLKEKKRMIKEASMTAQYQTHKSNF